MVMEEQQSGSLMSFNRFWITMEFSGSEEEDVSGFEYTDITLAGL